MIEDLPDEIRYTVGDSVLQITLDGITNGDCFYFVELIDAETEQPLD